MPLLNMSLPERKKESVATRLRRRQVKGHGQKDRGSSTKPRTCEIKRAKVVLVNGNYSDIDATMNWVRILFGRWEHAHTLSKREGEKRSEGETERKKERKVIVQ